MSRSLIFSALCALAMAAGTASAQSTGRPVRLVSPVSAGSGADALARIVGQALGARMGQSVIVDNRPGAEGAIAAQAVMAAPPDGHTLLFGGSSLLALAVVNKPAPFSVSDLVPVSTIGRITYGLFIHPSLPAASLKEFVGFARSRPGQVNYGSVNLATEAAAAHLMAAATIDLTKVPYKGGGQVMADLIAGRVQVFFGPLANGLPYANDGRLRLLAVHPERSGLANVPSMAEQGTTVAFRPQYYMVLVPAKTPTGTIIRLSAMLNDVLQDAQVRSQLEKQAVVAEGSTPERAGVLAREGVAMYATLLHGSVSR